MQGYRRRFPRRKKRTASIAADAHVELYAICLAFAKAWDYAGEEFGGAEDPDQQEVHIRAANLMRHEYVMLGDPYGHAKHFDAIATFSLESKGSELDCYGPMPDAHLDAHYDVMEELIPHLGDLGLAHEQINSAVGVIVIAD